MSWPGGLPTALLRLTGDCWLQGSHSEGPTPKCTLKSLRIAFHFIFNSGKSLSMTNVKDTGDILQFQTLGIFFLSMINFLNSLLTSNTLIETGHKLFSPKFLKTIYESKSLCGHFISHGLEHPFFFVVP